MSRDPDDEASFLRAYDAKAFDRPSVTVDVAIISVADGALRTLLIKRPEHPFKDAWSLPGGFVRMDESLDAAAERVLKTKAGLGDVYLEQLYTFGAPERDPRTRVITVAYYALVEAARLRPEATGEAAPVRSAVISVPWEGETGGAVDVVNESGHPMPLAFDHDQILGMAVKRMRGKLDYVPIGFQLLPRTFTLLDLQRVHETVLGRPLNKDSFRRRMLASGQLEATGRLQTDVGHRPAELYRFARRAAV